MKNAYVLDTNLGNKLITISKLLTLSILLLFLLNGTGIAQEKEVNVGEMNALSKAYGFLLGQDLSLEKIERDFPRIAGEVAVTKVYFESSFGKSRQLIEDDLREKIGKKGFAELASLIKKKWNDAFSKQNLTLTDAKQFIETVKLRSKGENVEQDVLEVLLSKKYEANPTIEYAEGWRQKYKTNGSGKSRGLQISLQLPKSWKAKEGERPHIVQKWLSKGGNGNAMIMLIVSDEMGQELTSQDIKEIVKNGESKEFLQDGTTYIDSNYFSIERSPGLSINFQMKGERAGTPYFQRAINHNIFFKKWFIQISCGVWSRFDDQKKLEVAFQEIKPVCQQVLNSIVLPQAYAGK